MHDVNYEDEQLMRQLGGKYVAWLNSKVLLSLAASTSPGSTAKCS